MNFGAVDAYVAQLMRDVPLTGAVLVLVHADTVVHERVFGAYTFDTRLPIASASKWISAAVIVSLIEEGILHLDERVGDYIDAFDGAKTPMTLRHVLAHTSGLPKDEAPCMRDAKTTLDACANAIAQLPLQSAPGSRFWYGENGFQVAGRMAEVATGRAWHDLFVKRVAHPAGLDATDYATRATESGIFRVSNPQISHGLRSTAHDLARFVQWQLQRGHESKMTMMAEDHTFGAPIGFTPNVLTTHGYGLGVWRDEVDEQGNARLISSPGAFGTTPWVDLAHGIGGVFVCRNAYTRMAAPTRAVQMLVREAVTSPTSTNSGL
jgi:CubicO group peptidase (beta-lactamase class C family)